MFHISLLRTFPIIEDKSIPRAFYRVFDKKEYAEEFLNGNIWTQPISQHSINKNNPRYDQNEGIFEDLVKIKAEMGTYHYTKLGVDYIFFVNEILKDFGEKEASLYIQGQYDSNSLSTTYIDIDNKTRSLDVVENSLKFGKYFVVFDFKSLSIPLLKYRIIVDFIKYNNKLSKGPFVKNQKYSLEQEIRILFPKISEYGKIFKIPPINGKMFEVQ